MWLIPVTIATWEAEEDHGSRPAWENISEGPHLQNK
jgi:hypothetical protein